MTRRRRTDYSRQLSKAGKYWNHVNAGYPADVAVSRLETPAEERRADLAASRDMTLSEGWEAIWPEAEPRYGGA